MSRQANRLGRALSFSYHEFCPGCEGSCTCHSGDLQWNNNQLATISCSFDEQPRVVMLNRCRIKRKDENPVVCGKLQDNQWDGDSETVGPGGQINFFFFIFSKYF